MQRVQEAREEYEKALKSSPFNTTAKQRLVEFKTMGK